MDEVLVSVGHIFAAASGWFIGLIISRLWLEKWPWDRIANDKHPDLELVPTDDLMHELKRRNDMLVIVRPSGKVGDTQAVTMYWRISDENAIRALGIAAEIIHMRSKE